MTDVLIVGGGPAGTSLAILLARAGLSIELHDRARFPRENMCGEGLVPTGRAAGEEPPDWVDECLGDDSEFERKRRKMLADYRRLTAIVLGVAGRPLLAAFMIRLMRLWPALFSHAMGVSSGIRRLIPGLPV